MPVHLFRTDDNTEPLENANDFLASRVHCIRRIEDIGVSLPVEEVREPAFDFPNGRSEDQGHDGRCVLH